MGVLRKHKTKTETTKPGDYMWLVYRSTLEVGGI